MVGQNRRILSLVAVLGIVTGCSTLRTAAERVASTTIDFADVSGATRGSGILWQDPLGVVHADLQVVGLPPGVHGIHFHAVGRCDGDFSSAGAHYNPMNKKHGL